MPEVLMPIYPHWIFPPSMPVLGPMDQAPVQLAFRGSQTVPLGTKGPGTSSLGLPEPGEVM